MDKSPFLCEKTKNVTFRKEYVTSNSYKKSIGYLRKSTQKKKLVTLQPKIQMVRLGCLLKLGLYIIWFVFGLPQHGQTKGILD